MGPIAHESCCHDLTPAGTKRGTQGREAERRQDHRSGCSTKLVPRSQPERSSSQVKGGGGLETGTGNAVTDTVASHACDLPHVHIAAWIRPEHVAVFPLPRLRPVGNEIRWKTGALWARVCGRQGLAGKLGTSPGAASSASQIQFDARCIADSEGGDSSFPPRDHHTIPNPNPDSNLIPSLTSVPNPNTCTTMS